MTQHSDPHQDTALWSQYMEGDLDKAQQEALEEHLRTCEVCRREVALLRQTVAYLNQMAPIEAPADFSWKVRQQVKRQRQKRRMSQEQHASSSQHLTTILLFGVAVVVIVALLMTLRYWY